MKQTLDNYINKHYSQLLTVCDHITQRKKYHNDNLKFELFNEVIIKIYSNLETSNSFLNTEIEFIKYFTKFSHQFYRWERDRCQTAKKDNSLFSYKVQSESFNYKTSLNNNTVEKIYIDAENTDADTKNYLHELINNDIDYKRGLNYIRLQNIVKHFDLVEKQLYQLFIIENRDVLEVYNIINTKIPDCIPYHRLLRMKKSLIKKIKYNLANDYR